MYATYHNNSMIPIDNGYGQPPFDSNLSPEPQFPDQFSFSGAFTNPFGSKTNSFSRPASSDHMHLYQNQIECNSHCCANQLPLAPFQAPRIIEPPSMYQHVPFQPFPSPQQPSLRWKAVDFMYEGRNHRKEKKCVRIALPINFECVPLCTSSSVPFQSMYIIHLFCCEYAHIELV